MISTLLILGILCSGIFCSYYDIKHGTIPNEVIIFNIIYACIFQAIIIITNESWDYFLFFKVNMLSSLIAITIYALKIWAGGDAKLFISFILMTPIDIYADSPTVYISFSLISIYSIAFIYIVIETLYLSREHIDQRPQRTKVNVINFILQWGYMASIITAVQHILQFIFSSIYNENIVFFSFLNLFVILLVQKYFANPPKPLLITLTILYIAFIVINNFANAYPIRDIEINLCCIFIVLVLKNWATQYNYKTINVNELKKGMILSASTVMLFSASRIKNLPTCLTEDMSGRITEEEITAIQKWSKSKKGIEEITIVRKIPFAIFICIGYMLFLLVYRYGYLLK